MEHKLYDIRQDYSKFSLNKISIRKNPYQQFGLWLTDAINGNFYDPTAFSLSTVSKDNRPSSRMLLLKSWSDEGFVFFTNYKSRKSININDNNLGSMLFYWDIFERQIRIEGTISKISRQETLEYFNSRPYTSRVGAVVSQQSQPLKSRLTLVKEAAKFILEHKNDIPLPDYWGGYRLKPDTFEFWQGRSSRLHDRILFKLIGDEWFIERLYP